LDSQPDNFDYRYFSVDGMAGSLGAVISGVQLNGKLDATVLSDLKNALLQYKVLFFRDQKMDDTDHAEFARLVGTPVDADFIPTIENFPMMTQQRYDEHSRMGSDISFHADDSFHKYPTKMSILRGIEIPHEGGDTLWVNMESIYDSLSEPLQAMLEDMTAEHSLAKSFGPKMLAENNGVQFDKMMARNPAHSYDLVIRHPETGRKSLYISELLTSHINELSREESALLLDYLCQKAYQPEFQCRFHWENGSVAWWDNRCTVHRGIDDFSPSVRVMRRIAIGDEQRPSLHPDQQPKRDIANLDIVACNSLDDANESAQADEISQSPSNDPEFLAELNAAYDGFSFTPAASMRIGTIPKMFRGAALSAIFETANERGAKIIDEEILDIVQANR
jgi:taurine dioxygenase